VINKLELIKTLNINKTNTTVSSKPEPDIHERITIKYVTFVFDDFDDIKQKLNQLIEYCNESIQEKDAERIVKINDEIKKINEEIKQNLKNEK
jgi:hypothetical protein